MGSDARISPKDVVLKAVYSSSDPTRDVLNMIYSRMNIVDVQENV